MIYKPHDIHRILREAQFDPRVAEVFVALAEQNEVRRQECIALAQLIDELTTVVNNFLAIAEGAKNAVDKLKAIRQGDDDEVTPRT